MLRKIISFLFLPLGCILVAIYPIINFWSYNWEEVFSQELLLIFSIAIAGSGVLFLLFFGIFRKKYKAILATQIFLIMFVAFDWFFSENSLLEQIFQDVAIDYSFLRRTVLCTFWISLFSIFIFFTNKTKIGLRVIINIINIFFLVLIILSFIKIANNFSYSQKQNNNKIFKFQCKNSIGYKPDIYYIILDMHAREDVYKWVYNYKSEFTKELKKRKFHLLGSSCCNYAHTSLSIPSSLSMDYLDLKNNDKYSPSKQICKSQLLKLLKKNGYKIINISSNSGFTTSLKIADYELNRPFLAPGEFSHQLFQKTFFLLVLNEKLINFIFNSSLNFVNEKRRCIAVQLKYLKQTKSIIKQSPLFVFCHLLCPHPIYIFSKKNEGNKYPFDLEKRKVFVNETKNIDKKIISTIDTILKKYDNKPIIILQSDHGPGMSNYPYFFGKTSTQTKTTIKEKMSILNAIYLPTEGEKLFYKSITPVNTFRLILNFYFGTKLKILKDRCYWSTESDYKNLYELSSDFINSINLEKTIKNELKEMKKQNKKYKFDFFNQKFNIYL